ncbi:TusE/DsrC/DsvC family sulfur relay protein [Bacteroidota bacterium]
MAQKTIAGVNIEVTDEGYLVDSSQWTEEIAKEIAKEEGIELTEKHFEVIKFIRENESGLTIRKVGKSGIVDIKGFYDLFPGGPLKISTKIAGITKPASCV